MAHAWEAYRIAGYELWIASGRSDITRAKTRRWLDQHGLVPDRLLLRPANDNRPNHELKLAWMTDGTIPRERVLCVYDDRSRVVAMWRREGFTCFQVAPND